MDGTGKNLANVSVREQVGRDTISKYEKQFKAAGYASLEILAAGTVERVYCDYHDDFVICHQTPTGKNYDFHQVKIKSKLNHQWSLNEVFGVSMQKKDVDKNKVRSSFAGRLFEHLLNFENACLSITLTTNIHCKDDVDTVAKLNLALAGPLPKKFESLRSRIANDYLEAFATELVTKTDKAWFIEALLQLFAVEPNVEYLSNDNSLFYMHVGNVLQKYSEIELNRTESENLANNLLNLAQVKSSGELSTCLSPSDLDKMASIDLDDLLGLLSISKGGYEALLAGGDSKALRNASILSRLLEKAGAPPEMIEYCSKAKTLWDEWLRQNRHTTLELDINFLTAELKKIGTTFRVNHDLSELRNALGELVTICGFKLPDTGINEERLFGGIWSEIVRAEM